MLVLSRHRDESIMIGDNIVITVVDIRGDKVRSEFRPPRTFPCTAKKSTKRSSVKTRRGNRRRPSDPRPVPRTSRPSRRGAFLLAASCRPR